MFDLKKLKVVARHILVYYIVFIDSTINLETVEAILFEL